MCTNCSEYFQRAEDRGICCALIFHLPPHLSRNCITLFRNWAVPAPSSSYPSASSSCSSHLSLLGPIMGGRKRKKDTKRKTPYLFQPNDDSSNRAFPVLGRRHTGPAQLTIPPLISLQMDLTRMECNHGLSGWVRAKKCGVRITVTTTKEPILEWPHGYCSCLWMDRHVGYMGGLSTRTGLLWMCAPPWSVDIYGGGMAVGDKTAA